jgi:hypothetical protein
VLIIKRSDRTFVWHLMGQKVDPLHYEFAPFVLESKTTNAQIQFRLRCQNASPVFRFSCTRIPWMYVLYDIS